MGQYEKYNIYIMEKNTRRQINRERSRRNIGNKK